MRRERRGRGSMGTKETFSGVGREDSDVVGCSARETSWTEACWAADLRSR